MRHMIHLRTEALRLQLLPQLLRLVSMQEGRKLPLKLIDLLINQLEKP